MVLLFIIFMSCALLITGWAQFDLFEGDRCTTSSYNGRCKFLRECQSVYKDLVAGKKPEKICSFPSIDDIIICCPDDDRNRITITTQRTFTKSTGSSELDMLPSDSKIKKRIAAEKCTEYSRQVYALVIPPTLAVNRQPVNVSLCAIKSKKLIVGGTIADPKEFPHMAALGFESGSQEIKWQCGGSLVSEKFVLTAAHCVNDINWGEPKWVRVGDLNLMRKKEDAKPQDRRIVEIIKHPQYHRPSQYHDIALLKMNRAVMFDEYVRPACLPISTKNSLGNVIATGWGLTDSDEETGSNNLLKVTLPLVATDECNKSYRNDKTVFSRGIVPDWQICAGVSGKDTCQGDSGGPLSIYNSEHDCMYDVVGITSLGKLCGINIPSVYTRIYAYLDWLEDIIWRRGE